MIKLLKIFKYLSTKWNWIDGNFVAGLVRETITLIFPQNMTVIQGHSLRARDRCSSLRWFQPKMKVVKYTQKFSYNMVDLHLHARNTRAMLQISWGLYLQRQFHFTNDYKIMYYARQLKSNSGNSQWIYKVNHKFLCILPCTSCSFSSAYWSLRTKLWPAISHRSWKIQILEWAHQTYFIQGNNISDYHIIIL